MAKRDISKISSEELYKLAQQRAAEEEKEQQAKKMQQLAALRKKRKKLVSDHNKAVAAIDREITALTGRKQRKASTKRTGNISSEILAMLSSGKKDTKAIRARLDAKGISTTNMAQTLAYLKRTGQIIAVSRGVYKRG